MPTPRNDKPKPNPNTYTPRQFAIALAVVLVGVSIGSIVVLKKADQIPGPRIGYPTKQEIDQRRANSIASRAPIELGAWTNGMAYIPAGTFYMGSEIGKSDELPIHQVSVDGFWMDETEVTNEQFEKFVKATSYVTVAERKPDPKDFPGAPPEALVPGAVVFTPPGGGDISLDNHYVWWKYVPGASWRHPEGPSSTIVGREKHPVVQVAWEDAIAFTRWAGKRLPTEAEWEYAARGGLDRKKFTWGDELNPDGKWMANIWQGRFPNENTGLDGFRGTAPVATFPGNGFGLHDMAGNVWEWVADWYRPDYYQKSPAKNPLGPTESYDPDEPNLPKKVMRGGSFMCSDLYCIGYRPSARMKSSPDTGLCHTGFRCVKDGPPPTTK